MNKNNNVFFRPKWLKFLKYTFSDLFFNFHDTPSELIQFAAGHRFILNERNCPLCSHGLNNTKIQFKIQITLNLRIYAGICVLQFTFMCLKATILKYLQYLEWFECVQLKIQNKKFIKELKMNKTVCLWFKTLKEVLESKWKHEAFF